jgi:hypothetical protein
LLHPSKGPIKRIYIFFMAEEKSIAFDGRKRICSKYKVQYPFYTTSPWIMINSNSRQDVTMLDVLFTLTPKEAVFKFNKCIIWCCCIPRLHTRMKFTAIRFLDPIRREKISCKCNVDVGLIITGVPYLLTTTITIKHFISKQVGVG